MLRTQSASIPEAVKPAAKGDPAALGGSVRGSPAFPPACALPHALFPVALRQSTLRDFGWSASYLVKEWCADARGRRA